MNHISVLRQLGLLETLAFKFSNTYNGGWDFDNTYNYYNHMTIRSYWRSL